MSPDRRLDEDRRRDIEAAVREARRQNGNWKDYLLGIAGAILTIILSAAIMFGSDALKELREDKLDKEMFFQIINEVKLANAIAISSIKEANSEVFKRIEENVKRLDESIKTLWALRRTSRPHE